MKKVLFVTTISGFLPQFEQNDVNILMQEGCQIHYASNFRNPVYSFCREELVEQGILLHHVDIEKSPIRFRENSKAIRQLRKIMDEEQIDIVHCHNPVGAVAARIAAHYSNQKPYVIYTAHGFHFYKGAPRRNWLLFYPVERMLAHWTDLLVTINREDYERAGKFHLRPHGCVFQIHSVGVNPKRFAPRPDLRDEKRRQLRIPEDAFHIVSAAQLNRNKNQRVIVEAISRISDKDIYYTICGEGPQEEALRGLIAEKGLTERVRLLGFRTDMEEILQTADCFAFPSYREGLGVAAVEALLCGVPLIAADNRGTREYLRDGVNGIVCNPKSPASFEAAIRMLHDNRAKHARLQQNCVASAEEFTIPQVEQVMRAVYRKALTETGEK